RGQIIDSIVKVGQWPSTTDVRRYLGEIFAFIDDIPPTELLEGRHALKWKVPIGAATRPTRGNWGDDAGLASFQAIDKYLALEDQEENWGREQQKISFNAAKRLPLHELDILLQRMSPYLNTAMDFAEILSPAVACATGGKRVGIVPRTASVGDVVALFHGCAVPFLLRRCESRKSHYQVVG